MPKYSTSPADTETLESPDVGNVCASPSARRPLFKVFAPWSTNQAIPLPPMAFSSAMLPVTTTVPEIGLRQPTTRSWSKRGFARMAAAPYRPIIGLPALTCHVCRPGNNCDWGTNSVSRLYVAGLCACAPDRKYQAFV